MTNRELVKRIDALPENEKMECIKSIFVLSDIHKKINSSKQEPVKEHQSHLKISEHDCENKYRVSEEVMNLPFDM
ncbi:MAG: hypothetical protein LBH60_07270 [Prevotellaceae bacterium]|jgi:hypothetical protein|nr:hypothetical protein [Prevotellaceae bacterium]